LTRLFGRFYQFRKPLKHSFRRLRGQHSKADGKVEQVKCFGARSDGDIEKIYILSGRSARRSFNDIRGRLDDGAPRLQLKFETLRRWKARRYSINFKGEIVGEGEDAQLAMVSTHSSACCIFKREANSIEPPIMPKHRA
jgi:hypothetical protein